MRLLSRKAYFALLLGDVFVLYISVWAALFARHGSAPSVDVFVQHIVPFSFLFVIWFVVYFLTGLYGRYTLLFLHDLPTSVFVAQAINGVIATAFFFLFSFGITPKTTLLWVLIISTFLLYVWRMLLYPRLRLRSQIGAVLIGTSVELSELAEEVNRDPVYPLEFRAIVHPELMSEAELKRILNKLIESGEVSAVVADMGNRAIDGILSYLYTLCFIKRKARFIDARALYEEVFERVPLPLIDERWILRYVPLQTHTVYSVIKRILDIVLAIVLGLVFFILLPFIAIAIFMEDRGSIFYVSKRVGRGERPLYILKFRTMTGKDTDTEALNSTLHVTKVGAILRRFRLDEIPQFFNILRGELSFVGPRPELPSLADVYKKEIPFYALRHMVLPGLSGWAQVKHRHHPHHLLNISATQEKLAYDLYYVQHRSIWLDIWTTIRTLKVVVRDRNA